jgi:hypothetical protein
MSALTAEQPYKADGTIAGLDIVEIESRAGVFRSKQSPIPFRETGYRGFWCGGPSVSGRSSPPDFPLRTPSWLSSTFSFGASWLNGRARSSSGSIRGGFPVRTISPGRSSMN